MKLSANEPIFDKVSDNYQSPFPSDDSLLDTKYNLLLSKIEGSDTIGNKLTVINQGRAFSSALAIANKTKATIVGDLLNDWLPKTAWLEKSKIGDGNIIKGLFAEVNWQSVSSLNVENISLAITESGLNIAMTALSAIPVYGQIAAGILKAGTALFDLMNSKNTNKEYSLPFYEYSRDSDEDRIKLANDIIFNNVNWTDLFRPPFEINAPWKFASVNRKINKWGKSYDTSGFVFIPTIDKVPAWNDSGWGCIPGSFRVFAQVQQSKQDFPLNSTLNRKINKDYNYPWKYKLINCGDYFPSLAQLGAAIWQQAMAAGNPDMYKINTYQLEYEWDNFFQNLYSTANYSIKNQNLGVGPQLGSSQIIASQMVEPFLCYKVNSKDQWEWGTPDFFRPNPYYHDKFFEKGPVPIELRNNCLFVEEDLKKGKNHFWPYSTNPQQITKYLSGNPIKSATTKPPKNTRCISYPTGEDAKLMWASPYFAIIKPAILALRERQKACLQNTLVCAYLNLEYAAFKNLGGLGLEGMGKTIGLAALFLEMQKTLITNDARFVVNLKDVDSINPKFATELRNSGVTNSYGQMNSAKMGLKKITGIGDNIGNPIPEPPPTTGGIPFGDITFTPPIKKSNTSSNNLTKGAIIAGAGYLLLNRK